MQGNREAFERLEVARANEEYMAELRQNHSELVAEEHWRLELYKGATNEARPSAGNAIDLCSSDSDFGSDDDDSDDCIDWEKLENKSDKGFYFLFRSNPIV